MVNNETYLPIKIDFQQKIPLSEQIAERLRRLITGGVLQPGQPLPTVRQLAFQLRVNFNTVARAYRVLDAEGLIITWQGRGTFVEQHHDIDEAGVDESAPTAEQFIDILFEQAEQANIPAQTIWDALARRQNDYPSANLKNAKKKSRPCRNNKLIRKIIGWKLTNRIVKRRMALHGVKHRVYSRARKTK